MQIRNSKKFHDVQEFLNKVKIFSMETNFQQIPNLLDQSSRDLSMLYLKIIEQRRIFEGL